MFLQRRIGSSSLAITCVLCLGATGVTPVDAAVGRRAFQEGPGSVEELARGVMTALRQDSFDALVPYLPTAEDLEEVLAEMVARGDLTNEQARENSSDIPAILEAMDERFRQNFADIQEVGLYYEVNWDEVGITGYLIDLKDPSAGTSRVVDLETLANLESTQLLGARIVVNFTAAGGEHALGLGDCVRTSRGWLIMEQFFWTEPQR